MILTLLRLLLAPKVVWEVLLLLKIRLLQRKPEE